MDVFCFYGFVYSVFARAGWLATGIGQKITFFITQAYQYKYPNGTAIYFSKPFEIAFKGTIWSHYQFTNKSTFELR